MDESSDKSIQKTLIEVSRNTPAALVVGVAGFIGSHLAEQLLDKGIQVIGLDNLSTGKKEYLEEVIKKKTFHLINQAAEKINFSTDRLDYLFIVSEGNWHLDNILELARNKKSKIVFVSSIELYDHNHLTGLNWFKESEGQVAKFASENNLNARVVRLSAVFGPRMHFRVNDPINGLIKATLNNQLASENTSLEFSSRALFVNDAVNLIIKSMLKGSTASKIFDGVGEPVKVSEVKQILLDPLWHEARQFKPSELPPWPTPNLVKTQHELSWQPQTNLVTALKKTINYFKDHEITPRTTEWAEKKEEKVVASADWEEKVKNFKEAISEPVNKKNTQKNFGKILLIIIGWLIIIYGIFYPLITLAYGTISFKNKLDLAEVQIKAGDFDSAIFSITEAKGSIKQVEDLANFLEVFNKMGLLTDQISKVKELTLVADSIADASLHASQGASSIYQGIRKITDEAGDSQPFFVKSSDEFSLADNDFSKAQTSLNSLDLPLVNLDSLKNKVNLYSELTKQIRTINLILPEMLVNNKTYLVVLGNDYELRPGGGHIESVARIDFEKGKLKKIDVQSASSLDSQLKIKVTPPKDFSDFLKNSLMLSDSNLEPDFPTNAKLLAWLYNQETGVSVDGVIFWDTTTLASLLTNLGPVKLSTGQISGQELTRKAFSEPKNSLFFNDLQKEILNKLFFVPVNLSTAFLPLNSETNSKHLMIYLSDPKLLSLLVSENLAGALPRQSSSEDDFLSVVDGNFGGSRVNFNIDRSFQMETSSDKGQTIDHLRISYTNRSQTEKFPEGSYQNLVRLYLPLGIKITKASFGEEDIKSQITSTVDYGRSVNAYLMVLKPKQQKVLSIEYQLPNSSDKTPRLNLIKQPGSSASPFSWTNGNQTIQTDLSTDRLLELK